MEEVYIIHTLWHCVGYDDTFIYPTRPDDYDDYKLIYLARPEDKYDDKLIY